MAELFLKRDEHDVETVHLYTEWQSSNKKWHASHVAALFEDNVEIFGKDVSSEFFKSKSERVYIKIHAEVLPQDE